LGEAAEIPSAYPISDREFALFQALVHREAGIYLSEAKRALLIGRLARRLRALGLGSFSQYYRHVTEVDPAERVIMLDCICTNETRFFREPRQFEYLEGTLLPEWSAQAERGERKRSIRAWSCACSTGEEPYSLAMVLLHRFPPGSGWQLDVLATDLSTRALRSAQEAVWPESRADDIPPHYRKAFMLKGTADKEGLMKAGPEIRALMRFERMNLNAGPYAVGGPFDLILCRNVLIYFDGPSRAAVITRLFDALAPDGRLLLGHAENLAGTGRRGRPIGPAVYAKVP